MLRPLAQYFWHGGYAGSSPKLVGESDVMSDGSENVCLTGTGKTLIFKGVTVQNSVTGSQKMMNVGPDYGGLGDHSETGIGSVFRVLAAIFFIGAGKLYLNGTYLTASATTTLSLKTRVSGTYSAAYQAGLTEPSAPTIMAITAPSGYTGKNNGTVSCKISRFRTTTGAVSNASLSSNTVTATNQSIAVTVPSADANGQNSWKFYFTKNGFGGVGATYYYADVAESVITASVTASCVTDADTTVGVANGTLNSTHIGWRYTSAGDTTTYVTAVGAADSHSAGKQTITLNAASVLTTTQNATFTRAVAGTLRTYVFEFHDADLTGDFAPIRNYSPPAGIFAGSLQDVTYIDGCYGDTVDVSAGTDAQTNQSYTASNVGNAIAVSEPLKPESFPPDNYIFTGDAPTCLLTGGDRMVYRFSRNSLGVIRWIGGSPALTYDQLWEGIGVANQNNACLGAGGRLYAFTGSRSLVRMGASGEPDTLFAAQIMDDLDDWTDAVLGRDGKYNVVCVMNGTTIHAFYEPLEKWWAPIELTGLGSKTIKAAVTVGDRMYLAIGDNSSIGIYDFNTGTGSTGKVRTAWMPADQVSQVISRINASMRVDAANSVTVKVFANGDDSTARRTFTITPTTGQDFFHLPMLKPNVRQAKSFRIEMSYASAGGDAGFESLRVAGEGSDITF